MNTPLFSKIAFIFPILLSNVCLAQKTIPVLNKPPANISIDGNCKEWGDSLAYYNAENKINFAIYNTKDTLYMAVRVADRSQQRRILRAGFTLSIDPKGKKKESYSITFPLNQDGTAAKAPIQKDENGEVTKQDREDLMRASLTSLRGIKVSGFKDIEYEMITTSNTYGIKAAVNYDDNENLICEAAIPIGFFHVDDIYKNEWAFNFQINGITKPAGQNGEKNENGERGEGRGGRGGGGGFGGSGGRGGRGGGGRSGGSHAMEGGEQGRGELSKTIDFWEKFYLAK